MRRVLVTGAASGLGAELTRAFRERGDEVLATDREPDGDGADLVLDVTSDADWAAAVAEVERRWGGLDVLVHNAGIAGGGRLDVAGLDEWQRVLDVNLLGIARGMRAFTPMLKRQRSGQVVTIASLAGLVHPAGMAAYNAAKAGVVALTETIGHELAGYGVRAMTVCPSYFRTNLVASMSGDDEVVGAVVARLVEESPVSAADVAAAVLDGLDHGQELVLPDEAARAAYGLKKADRLAYNQLMRAQAAKLEERA
jgi:NAD(P)-dependent dehydrogenase (short-subunit alcohol dehydrogenase family)